MRPLKTHRKSPGSKRQKILIACITAAAIVLGIGWFAWRTFSSVDNTTSGITYSPPTEQEKQETEEHKQDVTQQQASKDDQPSSDNTTQPPQTNNKKTVTPVITNARQDGQNYYVASYVPGIFEDGGTCTATFTKGTLKVTKTSTGIADANHTTCPTINATRSDFAESGAWSVTLSYDSSTSAGSSTSTQLTVN